MPQARPYIRRQIETMFGAGLDPNEPLKYLRGKGWGLKDFNLTPPEGADYSETVPEGEMDCAEFLHDEWDYEIIWRAAP